MNLSDSLLGAFDHIVSTTRPHLQAIPEDRLDWRPHDRSWTIAELGSHLANLPQWASMTVSRDSFDVAPADGDPQESTVHASPGAMVAALDENAGLARAAIEAAPDQQLLGTWRLLSGGEELFAMPRVAVLRSFVLDHMIHHRGQLSVYLRLLDVPVPQSFGPTADFPDM